MQHHFKIGEVERLSANAISEIGEQNAAACA
jgi:hypothetical protein